jgi:hypothetical protein
MIVVARRHRQRDARRLQTSEVRRRFGVIGGKPVPERDVAEDKRVLWTWIHREDLIDHLREQRILIGGLSLHVPSAHVEIGKEHRKIRIDRRSPNALCAHGRAHCAGAKGNELPTAQTADSIAYLSHKLLPTCRA